jgi:arginyl-tRNA synthetase
MILEDLKNIIRTTLSLDQAVFTYPPSPELGDLSLACFNLAKSRKQNPAALAQELAVKLNYWPEFTQYFSAVKAVGPYLNFFIAPAYLAKKVWSEVNAAPDQYGHNSSGGGKRVMIEYSNGNTHKEYHVGHLRNISYGDAVNRLLSANGYVSIPVSYINDFGIHIAKTIWNWRRDKSYSTQPGPKGYLLGRCYAAASQILEDNPEGKAEVGEIMKEIESRQGENYKLWETTRQWSIDYFASIYRELGIKFVHIFYESEVVDAGRQLVDKLFQQGVLIKSQGAIIADLEKYGLGVLPVIRTDGTALYAVADLALASEKFTQYNLDKSIYVVDVRQSLYFNQLFKILELLGYHQPMLHLTYDFVTLPEGMMSSRSGNVITYQELKDKILGKLIEETQKRHQDWPSARINQVANSLLVATIKFEMLKVSADKIITFNINEALRFDGYTACYLQYGYARLRSILRKGQWSVFWRRPNPAELTAAKERELLLKIARYPEVVASAGLSYNPSELTKYLFELVQLSNDYYHEVNILKAAAGTKRARLELIKAVTQVLRDGFAILGLPVLEEM